LDYNNAFVRAELNETVSVESAKLFQPNWGKLFQLTFCIEILWSQSNTNWKDMNLRYKVCLILSLIC